MPAGSYRFEVGSIGCTVLSDGYFSYPAPWLFPNADPARLAAALEARGISQGGVLCPYTCLLVQSGRNVILVDTGAGDAARTSGALGARLEMEGVRPRDVDTVVLSHAHPDHIGGTIDAFSRPVFRNARHVLAESEWEFWTAARTDLRALRVPDELKGNRALSARRCLGALRFQVELADRETEIAPGVRVIPAPGHTPGHLAVLISSGGQHLLNIGDAAVHPLHLEEPEWENGFDLESAAAGKTRCQLLERALSERMHVMAFHFPFPSVGRVAARAAGGWDWRPGW
jgi:glyoxylase-like metal-dependent hydrolase (beta-lactamase superfamily II)